MPQLVRGLTQVGTQILATGEVVAGFENLVMRPLGTFQFVGKSDATPVYEVLARRETATEQQMLLCEAFEAGLASYQDARWSDAARQLQKIIDDFGEDGPSRFYLARCRRHLSGGDVPEDPRVIRLDSK